MVREASPRGDSTVPSLSLFAPSLAEQSKEREGERKPPKEGGRNTVKIPDLANEIGPKSKSLRDSARNGFSSFSMSPLHYSGA